MIVAKKGPKSIIVNRFVAFLFISRAQPSEGGRTSGRSGRFSMGPFRNVVASIRFPVSNILDVVLHNL